MVPALRFWSGGSFSEYKGSLQTLVPEWPELNDALYWASIDQVRAAQVNKSGESLTNDRLVSWLGHFWAFDTASLPRLLDYMCSRSLQDDRLVALSTAFQVYVRAERAPHILKSLQDIVADDSVLQDQLEILLNPPVSEAMQKYEEEDAEYRRNRDEEKEQNIHRSNSPINSHRL